MATKLISYLKKLSETSESGRSDLVELFRLKNYGSNELSENAMWILTTASKNNEYLTSKLQEELSLDSEAPAEDDEEELSLDTPTEGGEEELSFDDEPSDEEVPAEGSEEELSFDDEPTEGDVSSDTEATETPTEGDEEELSFDDESSDEDADLTTDVPEDEETEEEPKIETSLAGVGILPLIAEIQDKLANGKPSEVELAALKAMKKLFW